MKKIISTRISGISYQLGSIPEKSEVYIAENPSWDMATIIDKTGIQTRHLSADNETSLDLAIVASKKLFDDVR
jgi:3-oxoacyl-[acyl-carrier-protein] synthase-3